MKQKYSVIKHNKNGKYRRTYDGYLDHRWFSMLDNLCEYTENHEEADFSILPIVWEPEYEYDEQLNKIDDQIIKLIYQITKKLSKKSFKTTKSNNIVTLQLSMYVEKTQFLLFFSN